MKKIILVLTLLTLITLACNLSAQSTSTVAPPSTTTVVFTTDTATPDPVSHTPISVTVNPSPTPVSQASHVESTSVAFGRLNLLLPSSVASGATGKDYPRFDAKDAAYWQMTPGHLEVAFREYYILQDKFHNPQIYVYPAQEYAELVPPVFESIRRVNNIIYHQGGTISEDQLPLVPFFNAAQMFASNIKIVQFQNGSGVRFLTEYAQYFAPVNNRELIYHFQGVTRDGMYYIIAIFPITVGALAETSDPGAAIPPGGILYPDINDPNADFPGYYAAISDLLNGTTEETFSPSIAQLDMLIQSMQIIP